MTPRTSAGATPASLARLSAQRATATAEPMAEPTQSTTASATQLATASAAVSIATSTAARRPTLGELLIMPPTVLPPFTPHSLGTSALGWAALLRDGDIVEVRPGFGVVPGTPITPELRAHSLAADVPLGVIVGRSTAAWVHTGHGAGSRVCVLYSPGGYRPRDGRRLEICQATVRSWETDTFPVGAVGAVGSSVIPAGASPDDRCPTNPVPLGPDPICPAPDTPTTDPPPRLLAVTNLVRTAMDIATWCLPEQSAPLLTHLVRAGLDVDDALHRLDLVASWRGAETARTRLLTARRAVAQGRPDGGSGTRPDR